MPTGPTHNSSKKNHNNMSAMIRDKEVDFGCVDAVLDSWYKIKKIPNYAEVAGEILFRKIFEIAPIALNMYSFGPEFEGREEELYKSEAFKKHARGVVNMLDAAVNMLGPDLEPLTHALVDLGGRHVSYGVLPAHYGIVGEALLYTLATALGDTWTPKVKKGWEGIYSFVSTAMIAGAERSLERKRKRKLVRRRKQANENASPEKSTLDKSERPVDKSERRKTDRSKPAPSAAITLTEITGMEQLAKVAEKQQKVSNMISDALNVSGHNSDLSVATSETEPEDGINYCHMVEQVYLTWDKVKRIPNYQEVAGVLLFRKIFEIAPGAKALFSFTEGFDENDEALYSSPGFLKHAKTVVRMLDVAVNMLGPDLEPVTMALEELGAKHVNYGVIEAHYPIVGQALLATLEAALGDAWTPTVKEGWTGIYIFVSTTMVKGAKKCIRQREKEAAAKAATEIAVAINN